MIQDDFKYKVNCDGCHKELINPDDEKSMFMTSFYNIVKSKNWTVDGDHCYCPKCTKALKEYGKDDNVPYTFVINNYTWEGNNNKRLVGTKLLKDGFDYIKSIGYDADLNEYSDSLNVAVFAIPSLIKFYADKGISIKQDGSFFELGSLDFDQIFDKEERR